MHCKCGLPRPPFIYWCPHGQRRERPVQVESHDARSAAGRQARTKRLLPRAVPSSLRCTHSTAFLDHGQDLMSSALMRWQRGS
ncbi:hypothetical protein HDV57DRAFT_411486 [Trichoderma longibrachiatum]